LISFEGKVEAEPAGHDDPQVKSAGLDVKSA